MKQLIIKDIFDAVNQLQKSGVNFNDIMKMPVYIGNEDEINEIIKESKEKGGLVVYEKD